MRGPFGALSKKRRRRVMLALTVGEIAQLGPLLSLERRMKRTGGPGIIPFELAGTTERSQQIIKTWGEQGRAAARRSLLLDYPFPATYASLQAMACTASANALSNRDSRLADIGGLFAWAQLMAAVFDYVENTSLLLILAGRDGRLPMIARRAALAKFVLIYAGLAYMLVAGGLVVEHRVRG
jgi:hypothetical protein